ncbi:hypothetical protein MM300_17085 [Evansella sp. LMS18]|jgi:hypothetical protein|uniref:hypothetical protein n=1 Tax=Evansella sp. LMS18 TaxID=2924033 RepID=UPI0020D0BA6A|nr:hypothetical protein [Evansella sp. LMS18]UTR09594.1 hypothetical protein MM300_17085 [Evansella sp. LMS18]
MPEYSPYSQNAGPEKQNDETAEKNSVLPHNKHTEEDESNLLELPPRSRVHRRRKQREAESNRKKATRAKKDNAQFPLVRILFILFFLIVGATITYPIWIDML